MERTFVMLKPDAMQRGLAGEIISRFERRGLKIVALKFMSVPRELAGEHYGEHEGKPFYGSLLSFITSGPVIPMVLEGENAVETCRTMMGATDPQKSAPGTIRGDYAQLMSRNVIHGSDSPESAAREIALWFGEDELVEWNRDGSAWVFP